MASFAQTSRRAKSGERCPRPEERRRGAGGFPQGGAAAGASPEAHTPPSPSTMASGSLKRSFAGAPRRGKRPAAGDRQEEAGFLPFVSGPSARQQGGGQRRPPSPDSRRRWARDPPPGGQATPSGASLKDAGAPGPGVPSPCADFVLEGRLLRPWSDLTSLAQVSRGCGGDSVEQTSPLASPRPPYKGGGPHRLPILRLRTRLRRSSCYVSTRVPRCAPVSTQEAPQTPAALRGSGRWGRGRNPG